MKFLFLMPQVPYPPQQGAAMRNWGIAGELATRHEVHLLCFGEAGAAVPPGVASLERVAVPARPLQARLRDLVASAEPDMARRLHSPAMAAALARRLATERFDVVQVEGIEMVPFARPFLGQSDGPRWVYDAHNAEADLQRSAMLADWRQPRRWHAAAYSTAQAWKLRRYERARLPRFDLVLAVSAADARELRASTGVAPRVVPNGVDTARLRPDAFAPAPEMAARHGPALLFSGKMDFRPNVDGVLWFVDEILPRLSDDGPPPTLWVVGQQPHRALDRLRGHPQVVITGWVEAVEPYLCGADAVVVPLRMGSGTRLKVLQALSLARPLVGTTLGCAGLGLRDGDHLRLADAPASFAAALRELLRDPARGAALGARARAHVEANFDWKVLVRGLEQGFQDEGDTAV